LKHGRIHFFLFLLKNSTREAVATTMIIATIKLDDSKKLSFALI
jgi:hypothetical protein